MSVATAVPRCCSGFSDWDMTDEAKLSRAEEKQHMQSNNNRLANYIDNVRRLQKENMRMIRQIEVIEESQVIKMI